MPEKKDFRRAYSELVRKHKLPELDFLDREFEISTLEPGPFLLRDIKRKMHDKIDSACKLLDSILQPEPVWHNMYEAGIFTDEEKKSMYVVYKELMSFSRACMVLEMECDDILDAKFISEFVPRWKKIKPQVVEMLRKIEEGWKKEANMDEKLGYFG